MALPLWPCSQGSGTCFRDPQGRRKKPAGKTGFQGLAGRWAAPSTPSPPHPHLTHRESGLQILGPYPTASLKNSWPPLRHRISAYPPGFWVGGRGLAEEIPGPKKRTQVQRTPPPNSQGCRALGDQQAKTPSQSGRGRGSFAGGRGAVPRRSGDDTPPWWHRFSRWGGATGGSRSAAAHWSPG